MSKENFKNSLFEVVECLTEHSLSDKAKQLLVHYFNESKKDSLIQKSFDAIEKYYPESMPPDDEKSPRLKKLLEQLKYEAKIWGNE